VLALVVAVSNIFLLTDTTILAAAENPWDNFADVDPAQAEATVRAIAPYAPMLDVDPVTVSLALSESGSADFVGRDADGATRTTEPTRLEQSYTVQRGDTISSIAARFDLHVATVLGRNDLTVDDIEQIKPGLTLAIPAEDTSDSTEWLTAINEKKAAETKRLAAETAKRQKLAQGSVKGARQTTTERAAGGFDGSSQTVTDFIVPVRHNGITRGVGRGHDGIDYRADVGTPVRSAADGRVIEVTGGWGGGFGISVLVSHGGGLQTRYAHLSGIDVSVGESVSQGEQVGRSGNTGFSTGPHLHFETRLNGRIVRPF
jgi:murein DD-endopeptidase MepM/ murein hydrolase activator NlpD